jgi:hypothetical protein
MHKMLKQNKSRESIRLRIRIKLRLRRKCRVQSTEHKQHETINQW